MQSTQHDVLWKGRAMLQQLAPPEAAEDTVTIDETVILPYLIGDDETKDSARGVLGNTEFEVSRLAADFLRRFGEGAKEHSDMDDSAGWDLPTSKREWCEEQIDSFWYAVGNAACTDGAESDFWWARAREHVANVLIQQKREERGYEFDRHCDIRGRYHEKKI